MARSTLRGSRSRPRDHEVHVDAGEDPRLLVGAVGVDLDDAVLDRLAALLQDVDHVPGRAAAGADQHQLHRARPGLPAVLAVRGAERHLVAALGLADEGAVLDPS